MSAAPSEPTPSPLPIRPASRSSSQTTSPIRPHPKPAFPKPKLLLEITELNHPGASIFFSSCDPSSALSSAVTTVLSTLYHPTSTNTHIPPTRSVKLILRPMDGVAYTTGTAIDDDHKEIHFSLNYIAQIDPSLQKSEIVGVLVHEMVHCWQWAALSTAPKGLIEGLADFVRLKAGLDPPHWKKEADGNWDAGYQHTGYFLEWVESTFGEGSVKKVNERLKGKKYKEGEFWKGLFGKEVGELWKDYGKTLKEEGREGVEMTDDECVLVEREDEAKEDEDKKVTKEQAHAEIKEKAMDEAKEDAAKKREMKERKPPSYLV
ncbi:hypothetical protein MMC08_001092 [Hypocenomyce scalaris]|nr:hypothetical protein [Hypocenomyce scalaris]